MLKKITLLLCSFAAIYLLNFTIPRLMPGDPFDYEGASAGEESTTEASAEYKAYLRSYYGLDKPFAAQLAGAVGRNLRGDLGYSVHYRRPVTEILAQRLPWTALIMGASLGLSLVMGVALALVCVRHRGADRAIYGLLSGLAETPSFLVGVLLLFFVAARVDWIPLSGAVTPFGSYPTEWARALDILRHALLPVAALTAVTAPELYFTARASFLAILERPYLLNARAKGLPEGRVARRYILANALPPIAARFFLSVGGAVGGTLLVENVFAYPGLGTVMREAVKYRDYPMIQGVFLLSTALVLLSLLAADVLNGLTDRRRGGRL